MAQNLNYLNPDQTNIDPMALSAIEENVGLTTENSDKLLTSIKKKLNKKENTFLDGLFNPKPVLNQEFGPQTQADPDTLAYMEDEDRYNFNELVKSLPSKVQKKVLAGEPIPEEYLVDFLTPEQSTMLGLGG